MARRQDFSFMLLIFAMLAVTYTSLAQSEEGEDTSDHQPIQIYTTRPDTAFVPVYEFSPNMIVMTFEAQDNFIPLMTSFDSIFNKLYETDSLNILTEERSDDPNIRFLHHKDLILMDTTGTYTIWKNPRLDDRIKKYLERYYYIYGTKGYMRCKVKDVVFNSGSCTAFYGISVGGYDKKKCGNPLFSYPKLYR